MGRPEQVYDVYFPYCIHFADNDWEELTAI